MRKVIAIFLLAMLLASLGVLAAKENKAAKFEQEREKLIERLRERGLKFETSGNSYTGTFTSFEYTQSISNYTVNDILVFKSINISAPQKIKGAGAEIKIETSDGVKIDVHDNPTGLLKIDAVKNTVVELLVADDIDIAMLSNRMIMLNNSNLNGTLMIAGVGSFEVSDKNITATIEHGKLIFRAKPNFDYGERETHREMIKEMERNNVGAEVHIKGKKALDAVIYTDLTVNITNVDAENKTINIAVSSPTPEGKFIIVNIDSEVLEVVQSGGYKVMIDGKVIPQASSIQDLIDAKVKNETSKYLVTIGADGAQVIVYVQKFSEHLITIQASAPSTVSGFEFLTIALAIASATLLLRRI